MADKFERFKKYFKEYQERFGLKGYKIYFECAPLKGANAQIDVTQGQHFAEVTFDKNLSKGEDIRRIAKHEAIHLLTARLEARARERCCFAEEIAEACEELAFKLDDLIDG